jgi:type IV pilus assembly protein PilY1
MLLPLKDSSDSAFNQRYTMVFGAGYAGGTTTDIGPYVYVLDFEPSLETFSDPVTGTVEPMYSGGNVIKIVPVPVDPDSDIPNGVTAHMSVITPDGAPVPVGKESLAYYGGIAYFPDLQGQLWKLDLSKTALTEDNATMYSINRMFKTEGTLMNDRFGYNQMASTLVNSTDPIGTHLFQYFGTGDQAHIQRRSPGIANRIYGVKDLDWPATDLTLTGDNTISSSGIVNIDSAACDNTNVPGWYSNISTKTTLSRWQKIIGRAIVANKDVYFTVYKPEDRGPYCSVYGDAEVIKLTNGCGGGVTTIAIGAGLTTAPVLDSKGNIYVGVSNLATGKTLIGKGEVADLIGKSGVDNMLKIGTSEVAAGSSSDPGIKIKSWREVSGNY